MNNDELPKFKYYLTYFVQLLFYYRIHAYLYSYLCAYIVLHNHYT